jgi:two-component system, LytTR family, response regulator
MTLRTIIVDDEELARRGLRTLLEQDGDVEIVRECSNGREAIEAIQALEPQLAYIDIQMPGKSGFDVIAAIEQQKCPHVVFVTAFDEYAVQAFEVRALDYLLKPINQARFTESLQRARTAIANSRDEEMLRRLAQVAADLRQSFAHPTPGSPADRISVKTRHGHVILRVAIAAAEARLGPAGFVRIHRSVLVNAERVRELQPLSKGEYTVVLTDGTELKLSRSYRLALEHLMGDAIGKG